MHTDQLAQPSLASLYQESLAHPPETVTDPKLAIALEKALHTTVDGIPIFRGTHAVVALAISGDEIIITHAQQQLDQPITDAYGHDLLPFALNKALAELKSRLDTGHPLQAEIPRAVESGFPHHNGSASTVESNSALAVGVSGALPSPEFLRSLGLDPDTPIPDIPDQGFFDQLLARQVIKFYVQPEQPVELAKPAFLKWSGRGYPAARNTDFAKQFANFNQ